MAFFLQSLAHTPGLLGNAEGACRVEADKQQGCVALLVLVCPSRCCVSGVCFWAQLQASKDWIAKGGYLQRMHLLAFSEYYHYWSVCAPRGWRWMGIPYSVIGGDSGFILWHEFSDCKCHSFTLFLNMFMTSESMGVWISRAHYFSFQEEREKKKYPCMQM